MKPVMLVDGNAARVRRFREAVALYRETVVPLRERITDAQQKAQGQVDLARRNDRVRQELSRENAAVRVGLHVFPTAEEAMKFLRREPPYGWASRPAVVFTDLYLDRAGGPSFVETLKGDPDLRDLPAVVLCRGASSREVRAAWDAGSNAVVDLPWDADDGLARVTDMLRFWLSEAATPP